MYYPYDNVHLTSIPIYRNLTKRVQSSTTRRYWPRSNTLNISYNYSKTTPRRWAILRKSLTTSWNTYPKGLRSRLTNENLTTIIRDIRLILLSLFTVQQENTVTCHCNYYLYIYYPFRSRWLQPYTTRDISKILLNILNLKKKSPQS